MDDMMETQTSLNISALVDPTAFEDVLDTEIIPALDPEELEVTTRISISPIHHATTKVSS